MHFSKPKPDACTHNSRTDAGADSKAHYARTDTGANSRAHHP
jgi:hypothetical protein